MEVTKAKYREFTLTGGEAIGVFQKVAVNASDYGQGTYATYSYNFEEITFQAEAGSDDVDYYYTISAYYHGKLFSTNRVDTRTISQATWYGEGYGSQFINAVQNDADPYGDHAFGIIIRAPTQGVAYTKAKIGIREIYAEPGGNERRSG